MFITAEHLSIHFGIKPLLTDVNFYLDAGDKYGIIGINGTGKSTFLRVLAGQLEADAGSITRQPNAQISFLPQNPVMEDSATVLEQVFLHFPAEFRELAEHEAKTMLTRLGLTDFTQTVGTLSGGQRKRVALVAALVRPADILILDEPTNHLDAVMVAWLEGWLQNFRGALVMVTHDRYFLERVVNHITELSRGKLYHYEANYSKYLELKEQRQQMLDASERKRQAILRVEREWIQRGCQARTTKAKDRIHRYENLLNQKAPQTDDAVQMFSASSRLGRKIIELQSIGKAYDGRVLFENFSYNLLRTDRIGIVGPNGAGKTTLLNIIAGKLTPDTGSADMGSTVKLGYFSQEGRELDMNQRVFDFIHEIASEVKTHSGTFSAKQMMERFLFPTDLQSVPIGRLSGGERRRLYLLSVLMEAPNVLLLDEPTNDLDIMTLSILEDYLQDFAGPILTVSHDRFFLDKMSDSIWEVTGKGSVECFTGNWSDWSRKRREVTAPKAEKPKAAPERVRTKKLRFSYQEEREFSMIDDQIAQLEAQLSENEAAQSQCGADFVKLQQLQQEQTQLEEKLEERTQRWLYLTELKEKIDAQ